MPKTIFAILLLVILGCRQSTVEEPMSESTPMYEDVTNRVAISELQDPQSGLSSFLDSRKVSKADRQQLLKLLEETPEQEISDGLGLTEADRKWKMDTLLCLNLDFSLIIIAGGGPCWSMGSKNNRNVTIRGAGASTGGAAFGLIRYRDYGPSVSQQVYAGFGVGLLGRYIYGSSKKYGKMWMVGFTGLEISNLSVWLSRQQTLKENEGT